MAAELSYIAARSTDLAQALDRLRYRDRVDSARRFVDDLRSRGAVPALIDLGTRFGVANRALLGR